MKRILTTLFALAIIMAGSVPALAAGEETSTGQSVSFYPISVEEYTYGEAEEPRINKVYQLSLSDDPSGIPTEDFVRNGRRYEEALHIISEYVDTELSSHTPPPKSHQKKKGRSAHER